VTVSDHASSPPRPPPSATTTGLLVLIDLVVPIVLFYGLRAAGVELFLALVASAAVPAIAATIKALTTGRIEGLIIAVIALLLLSSAMSLVTGNPRFLLAKDAALTTVWGAWFFLSLRARRPLTFRFTRPLLQGRKVFDSTTQTRRTLPAGTWDRLWEKDPDFRRVWRVTTVIWGTALLLDAVVRVTMAYALPLDVVPGLAGSLWLMTFLALQVITNIYFVRAGLWKTLAQAHQDTEHDSRAEPPHAPSSPPRGLAGYTTRADNGSPGPRRDLTAPPLDHSAPTTPKETHADHPLDHIDDHLRRLDNLSGLTPGTDAGPGCAGILRRGA
jgi:intracellular septation protein A